MKLSDSQREQLQFSQGSLASLLERIIGRNHDASGEDLRELGVLLELIVPAAKKPKALRKKRV